MEVKVDGRIYKGQGVWMKQAKNACASAALADLKKIIMTNQIDYADKLQKDSDGYIILYSVLYQQLKCENNTFHCMLCFHTVSYIYFSLICFFSNLNPILIKSDQLFFLSSNNSSLRKNLQSLWKIN